MVVVEASSLRVDPNMCAHLCVCVCVCVRGRVRVRSSQDPVLEGNSSRTD